MKSFIIVALMAVTLQAQEIARQQSTYTVNLDSTETEAFYFEFNGRAPTATAFNPKDKVDFDRRLTMYAWVDSAAAVTTTEYDSLAGYAIQLTHDGYLLNDTLFFDFSANAIGDTIQYMSWTPYSRAGRTLGTTPAQVYIDFGTELDNSFGLKVVLVQVAVDSNTTGNGVRSSVELEFAESRPAGIF